MTYKTGVLPAGTTTAHKQIVEIIKDFVTGDEMPASERWSVKKADGADGIGRYIFTVPNYANQADFFIGIQWRENPLADYYAVDLFCAEGFLDSMPFNQQPGANPSVHCPLPNVTSRYHIYANAHRLIFCSVGASGSVESFYVGKFLPFASNSEYPMPFFVGGSGASETRQNNISSTSRFSFFKSGRGRTDDTKWFRWADGAWSPLGGNNFFIHPNVSISLDFAQKVRTSEEDVYPLIPMTLVRPGRDVVGALDGVYFTSGFNNRSENQITTMLDGEEKTLTCFQDTFRSGRGDFFAVMDT